MHTNITSDVRMKYIYICMIFTFAQVASPLGARTLICILYVFHGILVQTLSIILIHKLEILIRMHILDVLLLLMATTVIAPLFGEFQQQSNNAALLYLK